jgi:hypothetical protein
MNKTEAIQKFQSWEGIKDGYIFQYPKGHWDSCSYDSQIGQDIRKGGYIYKNLKIKAKCFKYIHKCGLPDVIKD